MHLFPFLVGSSPILKKPLLVMENISVSEAATLAGVGKSTIRRAIKKGELLATTVEGPNGEQFSVSVSSFEKWMSERGAPEVHHQVTPAAPEGALVVHQGEQAWDAVVESQQTVQKALDALNRQESAAAAGIHIRRYARRSSCNSNVCCLVLARSRA